MRIAIGAFMLDQTPSGLGVYTRQLLRAFPAAMDTKDALTVYTADHDETIHGQEGRVQVHRLPNLLSPQRKTAAAFARFIWVQTVLPSRLTDVHVFYSPTHHGVLRGGCPQVLTIHDLLPMRFPSQYRLQHYYFAYVLPSLIKRASAVIVDSISTRTDVHEFYGVPLDKMSVVYSAVDQKFRPVSDEDREKVKVKYGINQFILMVGASYPHKNFIKALEAVATLRPRVPLAELVIVGGRSEYMNLLKQRATELNLHAIKFLGYVSPEDLRALYASAQVLLYPSLYEGFGLPPLEAMACGCPVIASKASSLPEVCGDAAYYVNPCDIEQIADALRVVTTIQSVRERLIQKGFERVKLFSWEKAAQEIFRVIKSVGSPRR